MWNHTVVDLQEGRMMAVQKRQGSTPVVMHTMGGGLMVMAECLDPSLGDGIMIMYICCLI